MRAEVPRRTRMAACVGVAMLLASSSASAAEDERDAEARVLAATSGRAPQPLAATAQPTAVAPAHLDGRALEAWFAERYGAPRAVGDPVAAPGLPDAQAEAALLADIERRRRED